MLETIFVFGRMNANAALLVGSVMLSG